MPTGYFDKVRRRTPTRFWINNPTMAEMEWAIAAGARSCTTNPTYCSRLMDTEPDVIRAIIDAVAAEIEHDDEAAEEVYKRAGQRIAAMFRPLFERSGGTEGFVTIQGDPRKDDSADFIVAEALRHRAAGPQVMAKIPAVPAGIEAIERLAELNVPICATEIFGISQAIAVWEAYRRGTARGGKRPPLYVTHITGIFDRYLSLYAEDHKIDIAPEILAQAGRAVACAQHRIAKKRGYEGKMLGGGAAFPRHFTDMLGGTADITINWVTADEILKADPPIEDRINTPPDAAVIAELAEKLPPFAVAIAEDGLRPEDYKAYGPVVLFRNWFVEGYTRLVNEVALRRAMNDVVFPHTVGSVAKGKGWRHTARP